MTAGPRLRAYVTAGLAGLAGSLAVGDPAPALVGGALLAIGLVGLLLGAPARVEVELGAVASTLVEGGEQSLEVSVATDRPARVDVDLGLSGFEIVSATGARHLGGSLVSLGPVRGRHQAEVVVRAGGWGIEPVGPPVAHVETGLGMLESAQRSGDGRTVLVIPVEWVSRGAPPPSETTLHVGDLVSKGRGLGSEFADIRPYRPGDDPRSVNWRLSARSGRVWVNERHPERNGDVLLLVDARMDAGSGFEPLVDRSVRLAATLIRAYARRRYRLGLVTVDGMCRWLPAGTGEMHRRRAMELLMSIRPGRPNWEAVERTLRRAARRPALVLMMAPYLDAPLAGLAQALARSGIEAAVVELDVESVLPVPDPVRDLGRRVWRMEQEAVRERLAGSGVPVTVWLDGEPAEVPLARLETWRRSWKRQAG